MRIVKTKKELIKAIEDGERNIKVDSQKLYAACKLAEKYDSSTALLKHYGITTLTSDTPPTGANNLAVEITTTAVVTISISVLITAIAIIGILKEKNVKIKCKKGDIEGEIEVR